MTQKEELAQAQSRVAELDGQIANHASALAAKDTEISGLVAQVAELTSSVEAKDASITELNSTIEAHVATIAARDTTIATHQATITQLEGKQKNADEKAREIAARNGANLPAKQPEAGNTTTDDAKNAGLTGIAKARAYFADRQPSATK